MPQVPIAGRRPHAYTHHGVRVEDPYAWLRDPDYPEVRDPEILRYLEEENTYFEDRMSPYRNLVQTLFDEIKNRQPEEDASVPYYEHGYWYQWRYAAGAQYRVWLRVPADGLDSDVDSCAR